MEKRIYISPSNQSRNLYATGGTNEMHQCDKIAKAAEKALERCGFEVKVGKSGDTMANRCNESNAFKADIHLPIHTNAFNGKVTGGTLVMLCKKTDKHTKAGKALLDAVGKISPGNDYALQYRNDLYELNTPNAMSLYLEVEFHDTKTGADWIRNNITAIGEAIAKGICNYYGVTYKKATAEKTDTETKKPESSSKSEVVKVKINMQKIYKGNSSNSKGQVRTLQRILNGANGNEGYRGKDGKKLTVDGAFGANTDYAVRAYQKKHKLTVDGIVGQKTWEALLCAID